MAPARTSVLAALAVMAACNVEVGEKQLLFPWPQRLPAFDERIERRNLEIQTRDGATLRGWLLDVPDERFTVVYFYGNAQSVVGSTIDLYALADRLRADVACVDYRGYGFSGGASSSSLMGEDSLAVFDHVRARAGNGPIVAMGYSLGTAPAILIASARDIAALVLVAPPASAEAVVEHWESRLPWYARLFFDLELAPHLRALEPTPERAMRRVGEPVLVVHGTADEVVPLAHGRRLYRAAASRRKRMCEIAGEDHQMALFSVERYRTCLTSFLQSIESAP
jgi:fermentation-respiration switch protein FrsA (DUF1100 family)